MVTRKETILRAVLWCAILATTMGPLMIPAQEDTPATTGDDGTEYTAPDPQPSPNPSQRLITPRNDQSLEQQFDDEWECFDRACEQTGWDPYLAYDELVEAGYAVALSRREREDGLIRAATDGAVIGSVAGDIVGPPGKGAEVGAAIAIAYELMRSNYLDYEDDPEARRAISHFDRDLRNWDRKFAACLRPKGYSVSSP